MPSAHILQGAVRKQCATSFDEDTGKREVLCSQQIRPITLDGVKMKFLAVRAVYASHHAYTLHTMHARTPRSRTETVAWCLVAKDL